MKLSGIDIDQFTYPELVELRDQAELRMEAVREEGVPALRQRFIEDAAALGVTLEEVVGLVKKPAGRPRKARPNGKHDASNPTLETN